MRMFFNFFLRIECVLFYIFMIVSISAKPPKRLRIGIIGPQFTFSSTVNVAGNHYIAAMIMAIREINNHTDGINDELLPDTTVKFALRAPRQNYIQALTASLDLSSSVFKKKGVLGVIGTSSTDSSTATAEVFAQTTYKIPQVGYGAVASTLGHKDTYPYFTRTIPSDAFEGKVLASLIYNYFGWDTVTVFSSGDTYGNDAALEFKAEASVLGLTIEGSHSFWSGIKDFSSLINQVLSDGGVLKVFVLLMKSDDAGLLLEQGYKLGLFTTGTQILGTQYVATSSTWAAMSSDADVAAIMNGFIGVTPTISSARLKPNFLSFVERWRAQKSTKYSDSSGKQVCDNSTDDDGGTYLYKGYATGVASLGYTCVGVNFQSFAVDGSDIDDTALYAYDATYALARAFHIHYYTNNQVNVTGEQIINILINNISFVGVTGNISFQTGGDGIELYGRGDRELGLDYQILNFAPLAYHAQVNLGASALRTTGIWSMDDHKFTPCDMSTVTLCSGWIFRTKDNSIPIDVAPIKEVQMSNSIRVGLRFGGAMTMFMALVFTIITYSCREHRIVKAAQPTMLYIVLLGSFLASIRIILATIDLTDSICIVGKWLGHLSFGLVFGAMILKTWRVNKVVHRGKKRVKITNKHLQAIMGALFLLFCTYLLIDMFVGVPHRSYTEYFDGHYNVRLIKCQNKNQLVTIILFVLEGLLLVAGAKMCWSTKSVPDAVNDSYYIAMCLYMIIFVCAVTFPIVFLSITPTPTILITIMATGFIVATTGSTLLLFGPKSWLLWQGADVDENFGIVLATDKNATTNALATLKNQIKAKISSGSKSSGASASVNNTPSTAFNPHHQVAVSAEVMKPLNIPKGYKSSRGTKTDRVQQDSINSLRPLPESLTEVEKEEADSEHKATEND